MRASIARTTVLKRGDFPRAARFGAGTGVRPARVIRAEIDIDMVPLNYYIFIFRTMSRDGSIEDTVAAKERRQGWGGGGVGGGSFTIFADIVKRTIWVGSQGVNIVSIHLQ